MALMDEILELGLAYHGRLEEVKTGMMRCEERDRLFVVYEFGNFRVGDETSRDKHLYMLKAKLVEAALKGANAKDEMKDMDIEKALIKLLGQWSGHEVEDITMRAMRLTKSF